VEGSQLSGAEEGILDGEELGEWAGCQHRSGVDDGCGRRFQALLLGELVGVVEEGVGDEVGGGRFL